MYSGKVKVQDLASFAGNYYETVFRIMNELTQDHILTISGKNILIIDPEKINQVNKRIRL